MGVQCSVVFFHSLKLIGQGLRYGGRPSYVLLVAEYMSGVGSDRMSL